MTIRVLIALGWIALVVGVIGIASMPLRLAGGILVTNGVVLIVGACIIFAIQSGFEGLIEVIKRSGQNGASGD